MLEKTVNIPAFLPSFVLVQDPDLEHLSLGVGRAVSVREIQAVGPVFEGLLGPYPGPLRTLILSPPLDAAVNPSS